MRGPRRAVAPTYYRYVSTFRLPRERIVSRIANDTTVLSNVFRRYTSRIRRKSRNAIDFSFTQFPPAEFCRTDSAHAAGIACALNCPLGFYLCPGSLASRVVAWVISSNRTSLHARVPRPASRGPCLIIGGRSSVSSHRTRRGVMERDDLFVEGAPCRGDRDPCPSRGYSLPFPLRKTLLDVRQFSFTRWRNANNERCFSGTSEFALTWLVPPNFNDPRLFRRIPVNNARDSPSGYFLGINYAKQVCDETIFKRCIRSWIFDEIFFFSRHN